MELVQFGYRSESKVGKFKNPTIFHPPRTNCRNLTNLVFFWPFLGTNELIFNAKKKKTHISLLKDTSCELYIFIFI